MLITAAGDAVWITLRQKVSKHRWPGAWVNSLFRREGGAMRASDLIRAAVAETISAWGPLPEPHGLITFIDASATRSRRSKSSLPGECYRCAGFVEIGTTTGGHGRSPKIVLQLRGAA